MRSRLPIEALRAFVRAAVLGSFRAAAASLHLTPGALSQRIAELERF
jgi:LysR family glycine cleavage system transcriptional activator